MGVYLPTCIEYHYFKTLYKYSTQSQYMNSEIVSLEVCALSKCKTLTYFEPVMGFYLLVYVSVHFFSILFNFLSGL